MSDKSFKTIQQQIDILKSRGLTIDDEKKAADFLINNNYYRISGYSLTLRSHDVFSKNASFQNIIDIYKFDHELRHILLKYLEIIEVRFKSIYSYEFAKVHNATEYLNEGYFADSHMHKKLLDKSKEQIKKRLPHEAYLKHFIEDLKEPLPLWAYVDLLTISDISFFYVITEPDIQKTIASQYDIPCKILAKFMHSMTILRNLCAHGNRLYNRLFEQKPKLNKDERLLLRTLKNGNVDDAHLYSFIIIMKRLLLSEDFIRMKNELISLTHKYPFVHMRYYGFNDNWINML